MAHIMPEEARAWAEGSKLSVTALDIDLESQISEEVLRRLDSGFDVTGWTSETTTPNLVRVIIAKMYIAWLYDRQYSEDIEAGSNYADRLKANAELLMAGLLDGTIELPGVDAGTSGTAVFYPTDASSALEPTSDDLSLGPAAFSMGMRF
jgi:hypothetical protein